MPGRSVPMALSDPSGINLPRLAVPIRAGFVGLPRTLGDGARQPRPVRYLAARRMPARLAQGFDRLDAEL